MSSTSTHALGVQRAFAQSQLNRDVLSRDLGLVRLHLYILHRDIHMIFYFNEKDKDDMNIGQDDKNTQKISNKFQRLI